METLQLDLIIFCLFCVNMNVHYSCFISGKGVCTHVQVHICILFSVSDTCMCMLVIIYLLVTWHVHASTISILWVYTALKQVEGGSWVVWVITLSVLIILRYYMLISICGFFSENIYYTNYMTTDVYIDVSRLNGSHRMTIFKSDSASPSHLAVNPLKRYNSFTVWSRPPVYLHVHNTISRNLSFIIVW